MEKEKIKIVVRKSPNDKAFTSKDLSFTVDLDLLDYGITCELKRLAKTLVEIYRKSNSIAVIDLLGDISNSIQVFEPERVEKSLTRKDMVDMNMLSEKKGG